MGAIFTGTNEELRDHPFAAYHSENIGFSFHYRVMHEYLTGEAKEYTREEPDRFNDDKMTEHTYSVGNDDIVLDWSEEREQFLIKLESSVNDAARKMLAFFSVDSKEIESRIDNNQPLLAE